MKRSLRAACVLAAAVMAFGCFGGCGSNNNNNENNNKDYVVAKNWGKERVYSVKFDCLPNDVMPIAGYVGPTKEAVDANGTTIPSLATDETFALLEDAGINMVIGRHDDISTSHDAVMGLLDLAEAHNMCYWIIDSSVLNFNTGYVTSEDFETAMADYIDHKAFAGLYVMDEPRNDAQWDIVAKLTEAFYMGIGSRKIHPYVNLLPYVTYARADMYEAYLQTYMETSPRYIAYDHYPFLTGKTVGDYYFTNLSFIWKYANQGKIPFWSFMQSCGGNQDDHSMRCPNAGELLWEVNTTLAYGCKGIKWFPLIQPYYWAGTQTKGDSGILDYAGEKTQFYDAVKNCDAVVGAVDHVLMNAQSMGVIFVGTTPSPKANYGGEVKKDDKFRELTKVEGEAVLVGLFDYNGKTALYVVNNSTTEAGTVKLTFDNKYLYDVYEGTAEKKQVKGTELQFDFGIGEAALVVLN